jgi:sugar lactone lactonase YvrE
MKSLALCSLLGLALVGSALAADTKPAARAFAVVPLGNPRSIAVDAVGNLYVGDVDSGTVNKITPAGEVSTLGAGGPAIHDPIGLAVDRKGAIYAADADGNSVFKLVGTAAAVPVGKPGTGSTDGTYTTPTGVAVDSAGNAYVTDNGNNVIRKVTPAGAMSVFAGKGGASGSNDGPGDAARFATPRGIAIDGKDNLYVADEGNSNIRKITPAGVVTTLAGTAGQSGAANGTGAAASFSAPRSLSADAAGNVFVADTDNHTVRKITPAGVVTTLAGKAGESGKADGIAAAARFSEPRGIAVDADGNVYVADSGNGAVRQITPAGVVTTIAAAAKP